MKIAIVTPYASPEKGACSIRVESFKNYFEEHGHEVRVFAPTRGEIKEERNVVRYKSLRELMGLLYKDEFDAVMGVSTLLMHLFFVLVLCKIRRIPFILDSKEPFTHTLSSLGVLSERSLKFKIYSLIERFIYKYSNKIFVLTEFNREFLIEKYKIKAEKVVLVMNGTDSKIIRRSSEEGDKTRETLGIPKEATVLVYAGGLGDEEVDQFLISVKEEIKKYNLYILFIIALEDSPQAKNQFEQLLSLVKKLEIGENVRIVENVDYEDMYKYLSAGDIGIVPWPNELIFSLPVKIFDYLATELFIVAKGPEKGSMRDFFDKNDIGYYATNWGEFRETLNIIFQNFGAMEEKGKNGRKIVIEKFTRENANKIALETVTN